MAIEAPWSEPELASELQDKLGSNWQEQLQATWGSDWQKSCAEELAQELGSDWADDPEAVVQKLTELLTPAGEPAGTGVIGEAAPIDPPRSDQPLVVDLGQYSWLKTVSESDSMKSWLVRVGVPDEQATALADGKAPETATPSSADDNRPLSVDFDQYQWISTVRGSDSLKSWLVRVGVPDEQATALADGGGTAPTTEAGAQSSGQAGAAMTEDEYMATMDLSEYAWLATVTESTSLQDWLVRIGVSDRDAAAFVEAAKQ